MKTIKNFFSEFEAKSIIDKEIFSSLNEEKKQFSINDLNFDSYVTFNNQIDLTENIFFNHLLKNKNIKPELLFENPTYKTIEIDINKPLSFVINQFLNLEIPLQDIHYYAFEITLNDNYLYQIAKIRALRILMLRLWQCIDYDINYIFPVYIKIYYNREINDHQNMIPITYQIMIAMITNLNGIIISDDQRHNSSRLTQNAFNILELETDLLSYNDPTGGSFFIEQMTKQLVDESWENLINNK
jgi:hypothetical protein